MKKLLFSFLLFFLVFSSSFAFTTSNNVTDCYNSGSDYYCQSYRSPDPNWLITPSRNRIAITDGEYWVDTVNSIIITGWNDSGSRLGGSDTKNYWDIEADNIVDGNYLVTATFNYSNVTIQERVWVIDGKFYFEESDAPDRTTGSINYGLSIIIVLFSLFVITFIFNQMKSKKKWQ